MKTSISMVVVLTLANNIALAKAWPTGGNARRSDQQQVQEILSPKIKDTGIEFLISTKPAQRSSENNENIELDRPVWEVPPHPARQIEDLSDRDLRQRAKKQDPFQTDGADVYADNAVDRNTEDLEETNGDLTDTPEGVVVGQNGQEPDDEATAFESETVQLRHRPKLVRQDAFDFGDDFDTDTDETELRRIRDSVDRLLERKQRKKRYYVSRSNEFHDQQLESNNRQLARRKRRTLKEDTRQINGAEYEDERYAGRQEGRLTDDYNDGDDNDRDFDSDRDVDRSNRQFDEATLEAPGKDEVVDEAVTSRFHVCQMVKDKFHKELSFSGKTLEVDECFVTCERKEGDRVFSHMFKLIDWPCGNQLEGVCESSGECSAPFEA